MEIYINYLLGDRARFGHKFVPRFTRLHVPREREKEEAGGNGREVETELRSMGRREVSV